MPTVVGADRSYVKQGKDPETALRLSERPNADWIRLVVDSYCRSRPTGTTDLGLGRPAIRARQGRRGRRLPAPPVLAAVDRANDRYVALVDERSETPAVALEGEEGAAIATPWKRSMQRSSEEAAEPEPRCAYRSAGRGSRPTAGTSPLGKPARSSVGKSNRSTSGRQLVERCQVQSALHGSSPGSTPSQFHHMARAYPADDPAANSASSRSRPLRRWRPRESNVSPVAPSARS